ncbi:MAG: hypothetical protein ACI35S_06665 [Anaeroplasma sp.]
MNKGLKIFGAIAICSALALSITGCRKKPINTSTSTTTTPTTIVDDKVDGLIYVSPTGTATGTGSKTKPVDFLTAYMAAQPGDTILLAGGTYKYNYRQELKNSGSVGQYITIRPETDNDRVIFDFSSMLFDGTNRGIQVYGNFWYIYGIEVMGAGDNGMYISGSHNIIENCIFYNNRDSGLQLGRGYNTDNTLDSWPSYNLIKNCTAFANYDDLTFGENADGFAAKLTIGQGNYFDGCIAFRNSDDGWDLYAKQDSGNIGTVTLYNCVSFENGYLPYSITKNNADGSTQTTYDTLNGDGIGFKLGGSVMEGDVVVENCISFNNKLHGFGDNSNPGFISVKNITAYNNCAGLDSEGKINCTRGIPDLTNKSNNIDLARSTASYNNYYGVVSYINNQNNYTPVGDSEYNTDSFKGSVAYSIFQTKYEAGEKYVAFTGAEDGSSYHSATEDIAFSGGTDYEGISEKSFASLNPINALCPSNTNYEPLVELHYKLRNKDYSVNLGDTLKIVDENLLTFANGKAIGADLSKSSDLDYNHPEFFTFKDADKSMSDDELAVLSAYFVTDVITSKESTYQDFDLPKLIQGCEVSWSSSNTDIIEIDPNEDSSVSKSVFSKAKVTVPAEATKVTLTATISSGKATVTKDIEITVLSRNQELGELTSTGISAIRVNLYGTFNQPRIYALDASSITGSELPLSKYTTETTYRYATDGNSKYYNVDGVYTSVPGVYEVTTIATSTNDSSIKSKYVYKVYVVDPDCQIDFTNGLNTVALTRDGFNITGPLSNIEGDVFALVSDTELTSITPQQIVENEAAQLFKIETDSVSANFLADNFNIKDADTQYYVYYTIANRNRSNLNNATVYSFTANNVSITTREQFYSLARTGKIEGVEATSTTIYSLANDLDFADFDWVIKSKESSSNFTGLLNGNDHTVKNITIESTSSTDEKTVNVFYKLSNATILNINFDNIKLSNREYGKLLGVIGDMQGGYLHDIHLTRVSAYGLESCGGLVGQVTGGKNYITQCSLINPIPEDYTKNEYVISTGKKYAGGIVGNAQMNSDQSSLLISITDCMVIANIGDGEDTGGNTGGILGRVKNESVDYTTIVERCYYKGTIISKGQYNAGIVGDFDNGLGYISINRNLSDVVFVYNGLKLDSEEAYASGTTQLYAHKNSNPIVGRATKAEIGIYECIGNIGTWKEYYSSLVGSDSITFDLVTEDEDGNVKKFVLTKFIVMNRFGMDIENVWIYDETNNTISLKNQ